MERPEKNSALAWERADIELEADSPTLHRMVGWDKCCDEYEKFLPKSKELEGIITKGLLSYGELKVLPNHLTGIGIMAENMSKIILKSLGGG